MRIKEVEELIKIVGEGNLLEAVFIFLGNFQHFNLDYNGGFERNFNGLSAFIGKEEEQLDRYFNLAFSLQGLFLICVQAYHILKEDKDNQLNTREVIDKIYEIISKNRVGKRLDAIVNRVQSVENEKKLTLLNLLGNPKRESVFSTEEDFENKVLTNIKKLLNAENISTILNNYDREFVLNKCVIDFYYSIHKDVKVDKNIALLFSIGSHYHELSEYNKKLIKEKILPITNNVIILIYIMNLVGLLQSITPNRDKNRSTKYTLDQQVLQDKKRLFNISRSIGNILCPKNTDSTMKRLLKNQSSDEFERRVTNPKNIYYIVPQKEKYKNTAGRLILGVFVLSVGLCVVDYLLMGQKLFQPVKDVLPQDNLTSLVVDYFLMERKPLQPVKDILSQDNLTNLVIAAILTIIILSVLAQLLKLQQSPKSEMKEVSNESLVNGDIPR